jgi:hypothetical protein
VVVALDPVDEGTAQPVHRECPGHAQRFTRPDVRRDLLVREVAEVDDRRGHGSGPTTAAGVDEAVSGVQDAAATAHALPPGNRLRGVRRLAVGIAVQLEDGVAAQHEGIGKAGRHRLGLLPGQGERDVSRCSADGGLVDPADDDLGIDTRGAQRLQPGRGR